MKKFKVTFFDIVEAETEADAYDEIIKYMKDVADNGDVTAFDFKQLED